MQMTLVSLEVSLAPLSLLCCCCPLALCCLWQVMHVNLRFRREYRIGGLNGVGFPERAHEVQMYILLKRGYDSSMKLVYKMKRYIPISIQKDTKGRQKDAYRTEDAMTWSELYILSRQDCCSMATSWGKSLILILWWSE